MIESAMSGELSHSLFFISSLDSNKIFQSLSGFFFKMFSSSKHISSLSSQLASILINLFSAKKWSLK
jgi:hypothetical protein